MPRYFFDTLNGETHTDREGEMHPDGRAAREIATRIVAEMAPSKSPELWDGEPFTVQMRDEEDRVVASMTITASREPDN